MKNNWIKNISSILLILLAGFMCGFVVARIPWRILWKNFSYNASIFGTLADWVSGVGTVIAFIIAYWDIKNTKKQFTKSHEAKLKVYSSWEEELYIKPLNNPNEVGNASLDIRPLHLHIVPVNVGLDAGTFRFLGICEKQYLPQVEQLITKIKNDTISSFEILDLTRLISYDNGDVGDKYNEQSGLNLIYPKNNGVFETIKGKEVGKIKDKKATILRNKVNIENELTIIYVDPNMNTYCFDVQPYERPDAAVKVKL